MAQQENIAPSVDNSGQEQDPRMAALNGLLQVEGIADVEQAEVMFPFKGAWIPTVDATLIGGENFQDLINMRYNDASIEGVNGYTFRNETAIETYTTIAGGVHLLTQGRTEESHILINAINPSDSQGRTYLNTTAIGSTGNFDTAIGEQAAGSKPNYLYEDSTTGLTQRFSKAPGENVAMCNSYDVALYSGPEATIGGAFTTSDGAEATPIDRTEALTNTLTDSDNIVDIGTTYDYMTILTTRPIQGIKFYVETANTSASTLTVKYWNGTAYASVTNLSDGTKPGTISLAQTGTITFDSTVSTAKLHHFEDRYLYAYQIYLAAGDAEISQITVDYPMQTPTNVWDGIYRTPIQAQFYDNSGSGYEDYTLSVAESSSVQLPVGAIMDGMTTSDAFYLSFDEPMAGLRMVMLGSLVNAAASVMVVKYWNGSAWTALTSGTHGWVDGTSSGSITFAQTGTISWNPPSNEERKSLFGTSGYSYQITLSSGSVTDTTAGKATEDVVIDLITGIPAQKSIPTFTFPTQYKSKLFLCNYSQGNEGNRIDFSVDNAPDVFNGDSSSLDGYQSIYVGGSEYITNAVQLYNRFGSNLFSSLAIFKNSELYLLTGDSPIDYQLFPVSYSIGCPAPQSLVSAEVGFELGEDVQRNVAIFISNSGPMMFDGAILYPIRGVEKYFDPNDSSSVNYTYLNISKGWFDASYKEYNMLIPTGESTTLNTWLVYDLVRKKWFRKETGNGEAIVCGWRVSAVNGDQYIYGGTNIGKMAQLESGTSWGGSNIDNEVQTADIFPSGSEWDITRIRRLKFVCKRTNENNTDISFFHYVDTNASTGLIVNFIDVTDSYSQSSNDGVAFVDVDYSEGVLTDSGEDGFFFNTNSPQTIDISQSGDTRIVRATNIFNDTGWSHSFKFIYSSNTTPKGMQPIMWGVQFDVTRKDY
jgi:hypothetical protein